MTASQTKSIKSSRKTPINISFESVTPTRAKLWVMNTRETEYAQRSISTGTVQKYSGEMIRGDWHNNTGDLIRITEHNGHEVVLDGQHRLSAIIQAEIPQDCFVARNVPQDAFRYIDQGNTRTLKDVMDCDGWTDSVVLSAIGRYLWVYSECGNPFGQVKDANKLSAGSLYDWVTKYRPELRESWANYSSLIRGAKKGLKVSEAVMGFLFIKFNEVDPLLCHQIFTYFANTHDTSLAPAKQFIFAREEIGELLMHMKAMKAKGMTTRSDEHRDIAAHHILYAWKSYRDGHKSNTQTGYKKTFNKAAMDTDSLWASCNQ